MSYYFWLKKYVSFRINMLFLFNLSLQPPVDQGLHIVEGSRSHSDKLHPVGLLWTSDQPVAENSN